MSAPVATGTARRGGGRAVLVGVLLVGVLLTVGALSANQDTTEPLDPASPTPTGTKALITLLERFDAEVAVPNRLPRGDDADVALLLGDRLSDADRRALRDWVADGHTLVVADPSSELVPRAEVDPNLGGFGAGSTSTAIPRGDCTIDALADLRELDAGSPFDSPERFVDDGTRPICFSTDGYAFATLEAEGDGLIVGLASPEVFTNDRLDEADNAALATGLLAPSAGTRVAMITRRVSPEGTGEPPDAQDSLSSLIGIGVRLLLVELVVAGVVYALARGRRLGRPILEPQPVQIAGSELVGAVGQLLQQTKDPAGAGGILRWDLRRLLASRLGVAADADAEIIAERVADRTRLERDYVLVVLRDQPVASDDELVALSNHIEAIRQEVLHGHAP